MAGLQEIILPEHNSSRLLFINNPDCNNGSVELMIEDTTDSEYCTETENFQYNNSWLLGKINNYIWLVEDVGEYDLNHEHTANIYYTDPSTNEKVILFHITRVMEYGEECDRLYMQHSGGFKLLLIDAQNENITANMYIKYEKNLPGCKEEVIEDEVDSKQVYYLVFYKYQDNSNELGISEISAISNRLIVNTDEIDSSGNPIPMPNINYCEPNISNVSIDFSKIRIDFSLETNNINDVRVGILGINSSNKKFISYKIFNNCIEPAYFIVQTPNTRSWICYRSCYNDYYGIYYGSRTMPNNTTCGYLNRVGSGLNGYFGAYDHINRQYVYEINITDKTTQFNLMIPLYFTDWVSITYKDNSNNIIPETEVNSIFDFFNELDGLYYKIFTFSNISRIYKIMIKYNEHRDI